MKSPCIKICQIDRENQLCTGCLRTLSEIAAWASYSDAERESVLEAIEKRRLSTPLPETG